VDTYRTSEQNRTDVAHIGKSVVVKGELSGSEDLYVDGEVEGSIELRDHNLTVGPNGRIRANITAKEIVIHGRVDGNITGKDRVELRKSAVLAGDIVSSSRMAHISKVESTSAKTRLRSANNRPDRQLPLP